MAYQGQGTVTDFVGFNAEDDCKKLEESIRTPLDLIAVICHRSNAQRQELKVKYKSMYGKDLTERLISELSGDFRKAILLLMLTPADLDATCINTAMKRLNTDEAALIEVIISRNNEELQAMKISFKKLFGEEMEDKFDSELSGDFKKIMVSLICGHREPEGHLDSDLVCSDVMRLNDAFEQDLEPGPAVLNSIIAARSFSHLRTMYTGYSNLFENSIETVIVKGMSRVAEESYLSIVEASKDLVGYFVSRLFESMAEYGNEHTLTRIMVSRCEVDMQQIKACFKAKYAVDLYSVIEGGTSGDYKQTMLALCRD